ncbi:hypothetical protein KY363_08445 [Candidatus Woesearchaeota archaeon]|nr:hypothetical protein [Candidatus Woesearchaeota archaeon]
MAKPLPKWIMKKYALLWNRHASKEFNHAVRLDPEDSRKRTYTLKSPEQAIKEMADGPK